MQQTAFARLRRGVPFLTVAARAALALAGAAALQAQPEQTFIDTVDVQVVEVDVVVTDRNGRPVGDLTRDDFEVYVDGERVEITNFFESEILREPAGAADPPAAPAESPIAEEPTPLTVALYLDDANLFPPYRTRLLRRLEKAAESWRSLNARFLLARFENRLEIVVRPTEDLDEILDAASKRRKGMARAVQNRG